MKVSALLGSIALSCLAIPASDAAVMPATAGHSWPAPDACMQNPAWDQIINNCNDNMNRLWIIPMQVDFSSFKHVFAAMGGSTSSNRGTSCQAIAVQFDNLAIAFSTKRFNFEFVHSMDLGTIVVPGNGQLHFECSLSRDSKLMNVEFQ